MKIFLMIFLLILSLNSAYSSATFYQISQDDVSEVNKLYENLNGENWVNSDGWPVSSGTFSVDYLPDGIRVELGDVISSNTVSVLYLANITGINFNKNNLIGEIPNLNLPKLKSIDLSNDKLSGKIPNFNLPELLKLDFHDNELSGVIPNFDLPELLFLILDDNQLNGSIPDFDLPSLYEFNVSYNKYTFGPLEVNYDKYDYYYYEPQDTILPIEQIDEKIIVTVDGSENGYRWYLDGELIDSSRENYYVPVADGIYHCYVDDNVLNFVLSSGTISVTNTGIENQKNNKNVRIIQTNEQINISTNGKYFGSEIRIFNNIGEIIYSGKLINSDESIDISGFVTGGYNFVLMKNNQIIRSKKFIIGK